MVRLPAAFLDRLPVTATYALVASLGGLLLYAAALSAPYPYADDWLYASAPSVKSTTEFVLWLFAQHVDHRIPLQKGVHWLLLQLSGYDFRWLIGLNVLIAIATCAVFIELARVCRGCRSWMDVCIPLIVLNPALPPFLWGFQMQFAVPTFAAGVSALLLATRDGDNGFRHVLFACLAALVSAASGMNGVVTASICLIAITAFLWLDRRTVRPGLPEFLSMAVTTALVAAYWCTWTPSARTSGSHIAAGQLWSALQALASAGLANWLYTSPGWKVLVQVSMLALGAFALLRRLVLSPRQWVPVCVVAGQSLALLLAAAIGRSETPEWTWMHALHYGFISAGLSVAALTAISATRRLSLLTLPAVVFFGYACGMNTDWRLRTVHDATPNIQSVMQTLSTEHDIERLTREHMQDFWWIKDDPRGLATVTNGIRVIRSLGYWVPEPLPVPSNFQEPVHPMVQNPNCNIELLQADRLDKLTAVRISGWLLRQDRIGAPHEPAWLVWRDKAGQRAWRYRLDFSVPRSDIPGSENSKGALAGFHFVADVSALPMKDLPVTLDYESGGQRVICDNGLRMKPAANSGTSE